MPAEQPHWKRFGETGISILGLFLLFNCTCVYLHRGIECRGVEVTELVSYLTWMLETTLSSFIRPVYS